MIETPTRTEAETDEREIAEEIAEITARLGTDAWVWTMGPDDELIVVEVDVPDDTTHRVYDGQDFGPDFGYDPF